MTEDKIKIEKFNGTNYAFWKMQMEDILYQKDLYLPIDGKKPDAMKQEEWVILDRKALGTVRLSLAPSVASNIAKEKTTADLFKALEKMYEKPSAVNKVYLMKKLFNLKMSESSVVAEHLNEFNTVTNQLESVGIDFDDEIRALVLLSSLPESWNGLVVAVSNSSGSAKIKLEDVAGLILGEEARRRASGEDVASGSALNTEERGRSTNRGNNKKGRGRSASRNRGRSKSRVKETAEGCWNYGQMGHWKRDCKAPPKKQNWNNQGGKNTVNVSDESENDALICSMDSRDESWIVDSGASFHATPRMDILQNYVKGNFGRVYLGDDEACNIVGKGDVQITQTDGTVLKLKDVRHVPSLTRNLISVGQLSEGGVVTSFTSEAWKMSKGALILARGKKEGTLYVSSGTYSSIAVSASGIDCTTWHRRLGHMSEKGMKVMLKEGKLPGCKSLDLDFCEDCILGKQKKVSFTKAARTLKTEKLELVHTDVWGPSKVKSVGGSRYFVTFIDDATRKLWVYFLKHKSNVFNVFKNWKALVENETGKKLKCLKSDNGGEYCSSEFEAYCAASGIRRVKTVPKKPRQNGVAERMNRTILERARSMRLHAGLPKQFWADAVNTAAYLINRGPSVPLNCGLPEEAWTGKKVNLSHLRVFGCIAYMHIEAEDRGKLDAKSRKCVFIGYDTDSYGYRLYDFENHKTRRSIDVVFNESAVYRNRDSQPEEAEAKSDFVEFEGIPKKESTEPQDINTESTPQADPQTPPPRRSTRVVKTPMRYSPSLHYLLLTDSGEPECFEEALQVETKEEWEHAMDDEMDSLSSNQTWDLVQLPKGKRALHNKWVYRIKEESDGSKRYKARLVVKGFEQKQGIDYTEIFSPVVKICTIRCVLNIVAVENLHLEQLDVKTAFLHGDLEEDIYMHQPEGYVVKGKENQVCKLRKSLYGLKQAPRQWYKKFDTFMINTGFSRCHGDHCCYFKRLGTSYLILLLYVDDMLVAGSSMDEIVNLKAQLSKEFAMKDLGSAKKILGMRISRDRANRKLKLSQEEYVNKVLNRFNMGNAKPVSTPLATHFKLSKEQGAVTDEEKNYMAKVPYASAVGSLMYAMVNTRPDIAYAVGVVSRFMANPGKEHWEAVKWILRYLRGTSDSALCFGGSDISLQGYVDSDLAGDIDSRKSTTGYVFTLGSAAVSWVSRLQKIVTISTTEAEYVAATEACKEMVWLRSFMKELGKDQDNCRLFSDSQSAIHLAKNAAFHSRTKHIDIKYHFIRSLLEDGQFTLEKIHTRDNPADMFTKVVTVEKLKSCSASVGLQA